MRVLVLNPGSATLKIALVESGDRQSRVSGRESVAWSGAVDRLALVEPALERWTTGPEPEAAGLRVVHGGVRYRHPVRVTADVEAEIERLRPLAPFHNQAALELLAAVRRRHPGIPIVAAFDTAFHADRPPASMCYALPPEVAEAEGIRRYGFHGIAHEALALALARARGPEAGPLDAVTLQLGAGCSACAIDGGRSIETSMGFTPLEGLVMATRSGDLDPGAVLHLVRSRGPDEIESLLRRRAGLLGLAGTADMREILDRAARGDGAAELAIEVFVRRVVTTIGAYLTLLEGRGAIVFGGGIGARSAEIRARVSAGLAAWDVRLDPARNRAGPVGRLHRDGSRPVWALETDEETLIADRAADLLLAPPTSFR